MPTQILTTQLHRFPAGSLQPGERGELVPGERFVNGIPVSAGVSYHPSERAGLMAQVNKRCITTAAVYDIRHRRKSTNNNATVDESTYMIECRPCVPCVRLYNVTRRTVGVRTVGAQNIPDRWNTM